MKFAQNLPLKTGRFEIFRKIFFRKKVVFPRLFEMMTLADPTMGLQLQFTTACTGDGREWIRCLGRASRENAFGDLENHRISCGVDMLRLRRRHQPISADAAAKLPLMRSADGASVTTVAATLSPEDIRQLLFQAAAAFAAGDETVLPRICTEHAVAIFEKGTVWKQVPASVRDNPRLLRWYGSGLMAIAVFCADKLKRPELLSQIQKQFTPRPSSARHPQTTHKVHKAHAVQGPRTADPSHGSHVAHPRRSA